MRKLTAALACRNQGSRLYGKPMQNLDVESGVTILGHMIDLIKTCPEIEDIVLGISEGDANLVFMEVAAQKRVDYIVGDENDVLKRLIQCGDKAGATDVFRVTTESPFFYWEMLSEVWNRHLAAGNDITVIDGLPDGSHFEIYTLDSLRIFHDRGKDPATFEHCSPYPTTHRDEFKIEILPIPDEVSRLDLRLTVDNPEDLTLCRRVYGHFKHKAPRIPVAEIIRFIDKHPELQALVKPYVVGKRIW